MRVPPRGTRGTSFPRFPPLIARLFTGLNLTFFRLFGRRARVQGRPLLLLTTVGARSGQTRMTPVGWFPDIREGGKSWLIVASAAGAPWHPAWFLNMAKHPDRVWVEVEGRRYKVRPQTLAGAERETAWQRVGAMAPGYGKYQQKTDREIPVIRLLAEAGATN